MFRRSPDISRKAHRKASLAFANGNLWLPENPDPELEEKVGDWLADTTLETERAVAQRLSELSHTVITSEAPSAQPNRAFPAISKKIGTCIAHTEVALGFATIHGLRLLPTWKLHGAGHATGLWRGALEPWKINSYGAIASTFFEGEENSTALNAGMFALADLIEASGQGAMTVVHYEMSTEPHVPALEATLIRSPHENPYQSELNRLLILPPQMALELLNAA